MVEKTGEQQNSRPSELTPSWNPKSNKEKKNTFTDHNDLG